MTENMYCPKCAQYVEVEQVQFKWPIFLLLIFTSIGPFIYIAWYFYRKNKNICPICGCTNLGKEQSSQSFKNINGSILMSTKAYVDGYEDIVNSYETIKIYSTGISIGKKLNDKRFIPKDTIIAVDFTDNTNNS